MIASKSSTRSIFSAAIGFVLLLLTAYQATALDYFVRAATRVQTGGFGVSDPQYYDHSTGDIMAASAESGPNTAVSSEFGHATATAYSLSALGSLHGYGSISASTLYGPAGGDSQITGAAWGDTITVVSDTLALGTPVELQATLTFHRLLSRNSNDVLVQTSALGPFGLSITDYAGTPNATQSVSTTTTAYVGYPFAIQASLYFQVNGVAYGPGLVTGSIDVSNTATFNLVSLNPAASYTTASGVSYAVPEPTSFALMMLAASGVMLTRRRSC